MGQAKQRGSFEERKAAAIARPKPPVKPIPKEELKKIVREVIGEAKKSLFGEE